MRGWRLTDYFWAVFIDVCVVLAFAAVLAIVKALM